MSGRNSQDQAGEASPFLLESEGGFLLPAIPITVCNPVHCVNCGSCVVCSVNFMQSKLLLICLLVIALLAGCSSPREERGKHFLWKVSDENSSVYLLGSIHFADLSFYPLDSVIVNAFDRSDELAVELDIADSSVIKESVRLSSEQGSLKDGMTLDMVLPEDVLYSLDSLCLAWYIPSDLFYGFNPWTAAMNLSAVAIQRMKFDARLGLDLHFLTKAREKKKIISLETVEEQVNIFTGKGFSDSVGIFYLKTLMQEVALIDSSMKLFKRAWKNGDDSLFRMAMNLRAGEFSHSDSLLLKTVNEFIYISRNRKMAESVEKFLAENRSVFVVVGAAHLVGSEENVIEILRRKGLTVEQL